MTALSVTRAQVAAITALTHRDARVLHVKPHGRALVVTRDDDPRAWVVTQHGVTHRLVPATELPVRGEVA